MTLPLNEIIQGDCLEVMQGWPDECIDLTVTSPPYDNLRTYQGYNFNFEGIAQELYRVTKHGGVVVWVVGDATVKGSETGTSFRQAIHFKGIGFNLHDTMIWNKGSFTHPSVNRCHQVFEYMFVFSKSKPKTFREILDRKNKYLGKRGASGRDKSGERKTGYSEVKREYGQRFNVWDINIGGGHSYNGKINHPAIFPEQLANDHIISWSNPGETVLDPMCGSGTTCKMSKVNNRNYIGIDISEEYCDIARYRVGAAEKARLADERDKQMSIFDS